MNRTSPLLWEPCPWVCAAALRMLAAAGLTAAAQGDRLRDRLQRRALQEPPWDDERDDRRSQAAPPPPTGTRVLRDLAYGQDRWQRMEVYLSPQAQAAPVRTLVQGVVLLGSGALDMPEIMNERPARRFYQAFGRDPAYGLRVSPLEPLQAALPPTLRVCSSPRRNSCTPLGWLGAAMSRAVRWAACCALLLAQLAWAAPAPWYWWQSKVDRVRVCAQISPGPGWERDGGPYAGPGCTPKPRVYVIPMH